MERINLFIKNFFISSKSTIIKLFVYFICLTLFILFLDYFLFGSSEPKPIIAEIFQINELINRSRTEKFYVYDKRKYNFVHDINLEERCIDIFTHEKHSYPYITLAHIYEYDDPIPLPDYEGKYAEVSIRSCIENKEISSGTDLWIKRYFNTNEFYKKAMSLHIRGFLAIASNAPLSLEEFETALQGAVSEHAKNNPNSHEIFKNFHYVITNDDPQKALSVHKGEVFS